MSRILDQEGKADSIRRGKWAPTAVVVPQAVERAPAAPPVAVWKPRRAAWASFALAAVVLMVSARSRSPVVASLPPPEPVAIAEAPRPEPKARPRITLAMAPVPALPSGGPMEAPTLLVTHEAPPVAAESRVSSLIPVSVRRSRPIHPVDLHSLPTPRKTGMNLFRAAQL